MDRISLQELKSILTTSSIDKDIQHLNSLFEISPYTYNYDYINALITNHLYAIIDISKKLKKELFDILDSYKNLVDGKVFKTIEHYKRFKKNALSCGEHIETSISNNNSVKIKKGKFCKQHKICLLCALGRVINQKRKIISIINSNPQLQNNHWYFIVTTLHHHSHDSLSKLIEDSILIRRKISRKFRSSRNSQSIWGKIQGGITSIETTHNNNGWNLHINWLVNSNDFIPVDKNQTNLELEEYLSNNFNSPIHTIRQINAKNKRELTTQILNIVNYILKYQTLDVYKRIEFLYGSYKKHLFSRIGNLRNQNIA